jgi:hypothetical protein
MIAEAVELEGRSRCPAPMTSIYQPLYGSIGAALALFFGHTGT